MTHNQSELLASRIREALGDFNDDNKSVTELVRDLAQYVRSNPPGGGVPVAVVGENALEAVYTLPIGTKLYTYPPSAPQAQAAQGVDELLKAVAKIADEIWYVSSENGELNRTRVMGWARSLRAALAQRPAEKVERDTTFGRHFGRKLHELRDDEWPAYLSSVATNYGAKSSEFQQAATWLISELTNRKNSEGTLAVQLAALREKIK